MTAKDEMITLQARIDELNKYKEAYTKEGCDKGSPEIRGINGQLFSLYSEKEILVKRHPELGEEYGGKKTGKRQPTTTDLWIDTRAGERKAKTLHASIHPLFPHWRGLQRPVLGDGIKHWLNEAKRAAFERWLASDEGQAKLRELEPSKQDQEPATAVPETVSTPTTQQAPAAPNPLLADQIFVSFAHEYHGKEPTQKQLEALASDHTVIAFYQEWLASASAAA